jgi:hypothetical protein
MKRELGFVCAGGVLALCIFGCAAAGPIEEGQQAYDRGDYATAAQLCLPLAERGDARAEYLLGMLYDLGHGVPKNYVQAAYWFRKAADQGVGEAQANLGALYASGLGVPLDYKKAILLWGEAAQN